MSGLNRKRHTKKIISYRIHVDYALIMRSARLLDVKAIAKTRNGECLSTEDIDAHSKLIFKCNRGHIWSATANHIKSGTWCPTCSKEEGAKKQRLTIEKAKQLALTRSGECLSNEYINARSNLKWQCDQGHIWQACYDSVRRGSWCPICSGVQKKDLHYAKALAKKHYGECLSESYFRAHDKLRWRCKKGHEWEMSLHNVESGQWCPVCGRVRAASKLRLPIEQIKQIAGERGGECLSTGYINARAKLKWRCSRGHIWFATYDSIRRGGWCPRCSINYGEQITREIFEKIFDKEFPKERPSWLINAEGNQMELDGFCQELLLAFEHQGEQHFTSNSHYYKNQLEFQKRLRDDKKKVKLCRENHVNLIIVSEIPRLLSIQEAPVFILKECQRLGYDIDESIATEIDFDFEQIYSERTILFNEIKKTISGKGWKFIEEYYKGSDTKYSIRCDRGHIWQSYLYSINTNSFCPECAIENRLQLIKEIAHKKGGECLSNKYMGSNIKLKFCCSHGHTWETSPNKILLGHWCPKCGYKQGWKTRRKQTPSRNG